MGEKQYPAVSKKKLIRRLERARDRVKAMEELQQSVNINEHGWFQLGYEKGMIRVLEDILDID